MPVRTSILVLGLFALTLNILCAQTTDASEIIRALNQGIPSVENGMFTIDARFKFADGEDTIAHGGVCYFFRHIGFNEDLEAELEPIITKHLKK